ncbi:EAL-associated domain-containing protein [Bacillus suaedae]|uniref:EAL domain-containing protein n=1 Tax=Halalkalibacter suaedae TaxID=2822140 RepID=A0A941APF1_9BACI|nr:EAL domain-containing protein [Bacillus suaedae]MBP3951432.1 EAL domain-containing protein [Bacillus suaedae]
MFTTNSTLDIQNILPYFQPIIGADQQSIVGYEILGRYQLNNKIISLGPYFHSDSINLSDKKIADYWVRMKAIEVITITNSPNKSYFFNINLDFFDSSYDDFFEKLVILFNDHICHPSQIVLEITENDFNANETQLIHQLKKYRQLGCRIAVDDLGKAFSNLERVALLNPHIMKVDLNLVQKSKNSQSHRDVLHALSILSQRLGAQLLFEGIETIDLLENAWKNGAQYYQGYLFAKPQPSPIDRTEFVGEFDDQLERMIQREINRLQIRYNYEKELNTLLKSTLSSVSFTFDYDQYLTHLCSRLPRECFRVYICNRLGYQLSGNHYRKTNSNWIIQNHYRNKNWSWRPFFLQNIVNMELNQKGFLSDLYTDIDTNELIETFSFPVHKNTYLFVDLILPKNEENCVGL